MGGVGGQGLWNSQVIVRQQSGEDNYLGGWGPEKYTCLIPPLQGTREIPSASLTVWDLAGAGVLFA